MTELGHLGDDARPCARHAEVSLDAILQLAAIGSRMAGFNHDIASKLQGLMMALDEINELAGPDTELSRTADMAQAALQDLNRLLVSNRTLTKPPVRTRVGLAELTARASERYSVVVRGTIPNAEVELAVPLVIHALALALDASAGPGRSRSLDVDGRIIDGKRAELSFASTPIPANNASESLAIASWVLAREGGELRCAPDARVIVRLPIVS